MRFYVSVNTLYLIIILYQNTIDFKATGVTTNLVPRAFHLPTVKVASSRFQTTEGSKAATETMERELLLWVP